MKPRLNLTGHTYGEWTVIGLAEKQHSGHSIWKCRCSCGVERDVLGNNLRRGLSASCGHVAKTADGLWAKYTSEYDTWRRMLDRCENPGDRSYGSYGARGIIVHPRWKVFANFIEDMGPRPFVGAQLDRRDNDGDYEASNCRWVTARTNMLNSTAVRLIGFRGDTMAISEWADKLGIPANVISSRLSMGWTVERSLTQSVRQSRRGPTRR